MGYAQTSETLTIQIVRVTKLQFHVMNQKSIPPSSLIRGVGVLAYANPSGIEVWKAGIAIEMDGSWCTVYPHQAVRLAQAALGKS
jgi:hypothetical protein